MPGVELLPDQEALLVKMIEEARQVPRHEQEFHLTAGDGVLTGPGGQRRVLAADVWALHKADLLKATEINYVYGYRFVISPQGYAHYETLRSRAMEPAERVEQETRRLLASDEFKERYPGAYERWNEAEDLLWRTNPEDDLTTIGLKTLEAVKRFADELVKRHRPPDAPTDPDRTVDRLRAVINLHGGRISEKRSAVIDAQVVYWGTTIDLIQRQKHGDQKEGDPVTWDDARAVVFQTVSVMFEIDRVLGRLA